LWKIIEKRLETQHWLETALDSNYVTDPQVDDLLGKCTEIGRLIGGMIAKSEAFCNLSDHTTREPIALYFVDPTDEE